MILPNLVNRVEVLEDDEAEASLLLGVVPHELLDLHYLPELGEVPLNKKDAVNKNRSPLYRKRD